MCSHRSEKAKNRFQHNFSLNSFLIYPDSSRFVATNQNTMFQQYIGDGANLFIAIVAVLIGFAAALGYLDFLKTKKQQEKKD